MLKQIINFYRISSPKPLLEGEEVQLRKRYKYLQWSTFLSATLGYGLYYSVW